MKPLLLFSICLFIMSCSSQKKTFKAKSVVLLEACRSDGNCEVQLLENKSIQLKNDEFGRIYYDLEDQIGTNVIKYTYNKKVKGDIQDASYREEIVFELGDENKMIADEALEETKMLFGRFCFCKGQTGYYKINKGKLVSSRQENSRTITLDFTITEVPQVINHLALSLK